MLSATSFLNITICDIKMSFSFLGNFAHAADPNILPLNKAYLIYPFSFSVSITRMDFHIPCLNRQNKINPNPQT